MEKKSTKIAYGIALIVVVIALVIAKLTNDGSGFEATGWALFPPRGRNRAGSHQQGSVFFPVPRVHRRGPAAREFLPLADGCQLHRRR